MIFKGVHIILLLLLAVDAEEHHVEHGQSVTLTCNTAIHGDVIWLYQHSLTDSYVYIYSNSMLYELYRTRLKVESNKAAGQYRLTISDVQLSDSGFYTCKEDGGLGDSHMFQVNVVRKHPGFLTDNIQTAVEGANVRLACNRTKYVDQPAEWKYKKAPDISELYIWADGQFSDDYQHKCELDVTDFTLTIRNVNINDTGLYFCTEDYGLGDNHFVFLQVEIRSEPEPTSSPGPVSVVIVYGILIVIIVIILAVAVVFIWKRKGLCAKEKRQVAHQTDMSSPLLELQRTLTDKSMTSLDETFSWPSWMPAEVLEYILIRSYLSLVKQLCKEGQKLNKKEAYITLAGTSCIWWTTMQGWPQSNTRCWFAHTLRRILRAVGGFLQVSCYLENGKFSRVFSQTTPIGKGQNGEVYRATHKGDQVEYALKKIKLGDKISAELSKNFEVSNKEVLRLKRLDAHRNIVRYYTSWIEEELVAAGSKAIANKTFNYYIQLELCTATLSQWIDERNEYVKKRHHFTEHSQLYKWVNLPPSGDIVEDHMFRYISTEPTNKCLQDILRGLNFMHSKRLAHGDLHMKNILIHVSENEEVIAKVSDFGIAKTLAYLGQQTPTWQEMDEPCDYIKHSFSEQSGPKQDMEQLAGVMCALYYPSMPSYLPECLKDSGWKVDKVCPEFAELLPVQARWISQLNDSNIAQRPTAAKMLIEGVDKKVFTGRAIDIEFVVTTTKENEELRQQIQSKEERIKFLEQQIREMTNRVTIDMTTTNTVDYKSCPVNY